MNALTRQGLTNNTAVHSPAREAGSGIVERVAAQAAAGAASAAGAPVGPAVGLLLQVRLGAGSSSRADALIHTALRSIFFFLLISVQSSTLH